MEQITAQGMRMDKLGLGTYRMTGEQCTAAVETALELGYRHIDTAEMYGNEDAVGAALASSSVKRDDIHLTSKVWWENLAAERMDRSADASLQKLGTDYVDLYLVHWPAAGMDMAAVMKALFALKESGRARAIGVANFPSAMLDQAAGLAPIACNQVEYHVLLAQDRLLSTQRELGVPLVAYAPLAQGRLAEHAVLREIAGKHGATPAQVALKWLLDQEGVAAIPKASRRESQQANLDALKLTLDDADRAAIKALPKNERFVKPGFAPTWDAPLAA
jgi:2,5-diketo-D-gluconate reductase B